MAQIISRFLKMKKEKREKLLPKCLLISSEWIQRRGIFFDFLKFWSNFNGELLCHKPDLTDGDGSKRFFPQRRSRSSKSWLTHFLNKIILFFPFSLPKVTTTGFVTNDTSLGRRDVKATTTDVTRSDDSGSVVCKRRFESTVYLTLFLQTFILGTNYNENDLNPRKGDSSLGQSNNVIWKGVRPQLLQASTYLGVLSILLFVRFFSPIRSHSHSHIIHLSLSLSLSFTIPQEQPTIRRLKRSRTLSLSPFLRCPHTHTLSLVTFHRSSVPLL